MIVQYYNGKRIQTRRRPFWTILHAQTRCRPVHVDGLTARQKTVENLDRAAGPSWAAGPPRAAGRWAVVGRGPVSLRAAGPSRACF